ncbi:hypothetical protein FB451DRAFT_1198272 [Mycena latifolia]|nr:hypothetical protein FB451DRAFT_1198272 [Mycena latifolia]
MAVYWQFSATITSPACPMLNLSYSWNKNGFLGVRLPEHRGSETSGQSAYYSACFCLTPSNPPAFICHHDPPALDIQIRKTPHTVPDRNSARAERNEKSRIRMARKRAELKARPLEEQEEAAEREKGTRPSIVKGTVEVSDYGSLCGVSRAYRSLSPLRGEVWSEACAEYEKAMLERKKTARARRKAKARAREPYHSGDERDAVANGDVADC